MKDRGGYDYGRSGTEKNEQRRKDDPGRGVKESLYRKEKRDYCRMLGC